MLAANRGLPVIIAVAVVVATVVVTLFPSSILGGSRRISESADAILQAEGSMLGGLDLNGYCRARQTGVAVLIDNHWECQQGSDRSVIDLSDACRLQHNLPEAVARQRDAASNYSWACFR